MKRISIRRILLFTLLVYALPLAANAQEQRSSLGRIETAMCTKADADGDSYRPSFCDARCDWADSVSSVSSCQETAAGRYETIALVNQHCDPYVDWGGSSHQICTEPDWPPVSGTESCSCTPDIGGGIECTTCSNPSDVCFLLGGTELLATGTCVTTCSSSLDCSDTFAATVVLSDVEPSDDSAPATYTSRYTPSWEFEVAPTTLNSRDARACLADIEALLGQTCTPFVP